MKVFAVKQEDNNRIRLCDTDAQADIYKNKTFTTNQLYSGEEQLDILSCRPVGDEHYRCLVFPKRSPKRDYLSVCIITFPSRIYRPLSAPLLLTPSIPYVTPFLLSSTGMSGTPEFPEENRSGTAPS